MESASSSRRSFVVGSLATAAATALSGCGGGGGAGSVVLPAQGAADVAGPPLVQSEFGDWQKLLGTAFIIEGEAAKVPAKLTVVTEAEADPNRPATLARHKAFSAYFEMDLALVPEGGKTYRMSHATKGAFDLFLGEPSAIQGKGVMLAILA